MFSSLFTWTSLCLCLTCLIVEFKLKFEFVLFAIQKSINKFFRTQLKLFINSLILTFSFSGK